MQKLLTTLAVLTVIATPAFAQSFDSDNGTGNVLSFGNSPIALQNDKITVRQSGIRAYAMVPRTRSAHATRYKEGPAYNGCWGSFGKTARSLKSATRCIGISQCDFSRR